jgi:GNAT superfamily N-acetyltransferase
MGDLLVKLYQLPPLEAEIAKQSAQGITIRRALSPEKRLVCHWVAETFEDWWASECEVAYSHQPISCFIATEEERLIGFACYDTTAKGFFGPTGVAEAGRGRGVGTALLLASLHALWHEGYAYAFIGDAGPVDFYARTVGTIEIPDSFPGVYRDLLRSS